MLQTILAAVAMTVACVSSPPAARAQPISCKEDEQCSSGFYCGAHSCLECLRCEDLHREPPLFPTSCIKSVLECRGCYDGLVDGEVNGGCVPAGSGGAGGGTGGGGGGTSPYVWFGVAGALVVAFVVLGVALFMYLNRNNPTTLTLGASACVHLPQASVPSAPPANGFSPPKCDAPPPYDSVDSHHDSHNYGEEAVLLPSPAGAGVREGVRAGAGAREAAGRQAARPFNNNHVRNIPGQRSDNEDLDCDDWRSDTSNEDRVAQPEGLDPPFGVDEETMASVWSPHTPAIEASNNGNIPAAAGVEAGAGAAEPQAAGELRQERRVRRASQVDIGPLAKIPCTEQDSNNNRSSSCSGASRSDESSGASGSAPAPGPAPGGRNPSVTLNFNLNVSTTALQQVNNVSL